MKATDEFTRSFILLEQYHSVACWKTKEEVTREYAKLTSETAKREAMKLQINIRTKGLGWEIMIHPWSKKGRMYTGDELKKHLVDVILPYEETQTIPLIPNVNLPSRQNILTMKLGTVSHDFQKLNNKSQIIIEELKVKANEELKKQDIDGMFQTINAPKIDENFVGQRIQVNFELDELDSDGEKKLKWYKGKVLVVKNNNITVIVQWDEEDEGNSGEKLLPTKWNKQTKGSWRLDIQKYTSLDFDVDIE